jgi:hypothetical protein
LHIYKEEGNNALPMKKVKVLTTRIVIVMAISSCIKFNNPRSMLSDSFSATNDDKNKKTVDN